MSESLPLPKPTQTSQITRGPVYFGDVIYLPGGECGPRVQKEFQLVILQSGWLNLELDGREIVVPPGSAILLSPGHREHFRFSRTTRSQHAWCSIAVSAVPRPLRQAFRAGGGVVPLGAGLRALLELAMGAPDAHTTAREADLETGYHVSLALALCCEAARLSRHTQPAPPHAELAVTKAQAFIRAELGRPLALQEIARAAGVSRQHLLKLFRDRKLPSPTQYLYKKRLETAADLLTHTGLAMAEIAERCGFANAFHFSRKFRAAYGISPRAWRQTLWANVPPLA